MPRTKIIKPRDPNLPKRKTGPKPGSKFPKTVERELKNEDVRRAIMLNADKLVRAGMVLAMGQNFIYKTALDTVTNRMVHTRVTDPDEIKKALDLMDVGGVDPSGVYYYIITKEPDARAIDILLNRALGKPKDAPETPDGDEKILGIKYISPEAIQAARAELSRETPRDAEFVEKPKEEAKIETPIEAPVETPAAEAPAPVSISVIKPA